MSYVDDDLLAILNDIEAVSKEAEEELSVAGEMCEDVRVNLRQVFDQGEDVGIEAEDLKVIMEARSTVHIKPEIIDRIFRNFKPDFWLRRPIEVDNALNIMKQSQTIQGEYI